jgi:hypothetical protein
MTDDIKLDAHHRKTVEKLFSHPTSHNIQWHDVLSLLTAVAEVEETHDGRFRVALGGETQTFDVPRGPDIDTQQVVDLRRMLTEAGYAPA